jgi:hypothetical protein
MCRLTARHYTNHKPWHKASVGTGIRVVTLLLLVQIFQGHESVSAARGAIQSNDGTVLSRCKTDWACVHVGESRAHLSEINFIVRGGAHRQVDVVGRCSKNKIGERGLHTAETGSRRNNVNVDCAQSGCGVHYAKIDGIRCG